MSDNELIVVVADGSPTVTRSIERNSIQHQVALVSEADEIVPDLSGATTVYTVTDAAAVPLDPPSGGADYCRIRVWHSSANTTMRLFFRKDGISPTKDGLNAEGYILHGEAMPVRVTDQTNFEMIGVSGMAGTFTVYVEWLRSA